MTPAAAESGSRKLVHKAGRPSSRTFLCGIDRGASPAGTGDNATSKTSERISSNASNRFSLDLHMEFLRVFFGFTGGFPPTESLFAGIFPVLFVRGSKFGAAVLAKKLGGGSVLQFILASHSGQT